MSTALGEAPTVVTPFRRESAIRIAISAGIAALGLVLSLRSSTDLLLFALVAYATFVWASRLARLRARRAVPTPVPDLPNASVLEPASRTAIRVSRGEGLFIAYILAGIYFRFVAALGGGLTLGLALDLLLAHYVVISLEQRSGRAFFREVPAQWFHVGRRRPVIWFLSIAQTTQKPQGEALLPPTTRSRWRLLAGARATPETVVGVVRTFLLLAPPAAGLGYLTQALLGTWVVGVVVVLFHWAFFSLFRLQRRRHERWLERLARPSTEWRPGG